MNEPFEETKPEIDSTLNQTRFAKYIGEATHRYPTSIYWGDGWFNDGFKYIVAKNDWEALTFKNTLAAGCGHMHVQKRDGDRWRHLHLREGYP